MTVFMFVARLRYISPHGCIHANSTPASVADATAGRRVSDWPWHRRNRFRRADSHSYAATDCEGVRPRIIEPYDRWSPVRGLHRDSRGQLPCTHYPNRQRHYHRSSLFRLHSLRRQQSYRRGWRADLYLRQRRSRNAVLRNTNGIHHGSNHGSDAAGFGLYGRRWFLQLDGSGHGQRELQFDERSALLHRNVFGARDLQDQRHLG